MISHVWQQHLIVFNHLNNLYKTTFS